MNKILGLDLGTTSIGWAIIEEPTKAEKKENPEYPSKLIKAGVRVIPYGDNLKKKNAAGALSEVRSVEDDFRSGQGLTPNAGRTLKRGMRRKLHRYKLRRAALIKVLKENGILDKSAPLAESGSGSTHNLLGLRAKGASEQINLHDFARVLLAINKKRGYKSNRKAKDGDDGEAVDGMGVAIELNAKGLTPGQFVLEELKKDKKPFKDFYRSDLQIEFDKVWKHQSTYYPEILNVALKEKLFEQNSNATWAILKEPFNLVGVKRITKGLEKTTEDYTWRVKGLTERLEPEVLAIVFQEINKQIGSSSGYLAKISDRSKELHFGKITVGQYLFNQINAKPHFPIKGQVFYRQDYMDEFDRLWSVQAEGREQILTESLRNEIRDIIIFYQRRLKSQKGLISFCEFEGEEVEIEVDGKIKKKRRGPRVIPKSAPLFQEFKIWSLINNIRLTNTETDEVFELDQEAKELVFEYVNWYGKTKATDIIKLLRGKEKNWGLNFQTIEGNNTQSDLVEAFMTIIELSGHELNTKNMSVAEVKSEMTAILSGLDIKTACLDFNASLEGKELEKQPAFRLWHLLYAYEGDNSKSGNEKLFQKLKRQFGIEEEFAKVLTKITFSDDYGSLSTKAIRKILPHLKKGLMYSDACEKAGYKHSKQSLTKEENEQRELIEKHDLLPNNSLRNPIVEKILNQMIHVVNAVREEYGELHEIRLEMARELKASAKERAAMTKGISDSTKQYEKFRSELKEIYPFNNGVRITKKDLVKYKLYKELEINGYKTFYTNTYVSINELFGEGKKFDIDHIIPQSVLFDDSYRNKVLALKSVNIEKGNKTAIDYLSEKYGVESTQVIEFRARVKQYEKLDVTHKGKAKKLLMPQNEIPDGFIERDLRNTQYISKKAQEILRKYVRYVTPTTGSVTDKLRGDWQLINVLKELNWDKYDKLGLTEFETDKNGNQIRRIKDWTKRNDHRHHAMDAITVAFTKHNHIQYLNYLSARKDETHKQHSTIHAIEKIEVDFDNGKRLIKPPMPMSDLRAQVKGQLKSILVSIKPSGKVMTRNVNIHKVKGGVYKKVEWTPRGQLHNETIYGSQQHLVTKIEKVGSKFDQETIDKVAVKSERLALQRRLDECGGDAKKAFTGKNSPSKNPIWIDEAKGKQLPEKVKLHWNETRFTTRKEVSPDLKVDKVVDEGAKRILEKRLADFGGDPKKAFVNINENPIWRNKEKGVAIKRVTLTAVSNAEALHLKKDHHGQLILDAAGKPISTDFVSTGNNHHMALYKDADGNLHDYVVSFWDAVQRKLAGLPIIPKDTKELWDLVLEKGIEDQRLLAQLPPEGLVLEYSMKQNEYFVFPNEATGFNPLEMNLMDERKYHLISPNLFRVQKFSKLAYGNSFVREYVFRNHLETMLIDKKVLKEVSFKNIKSLKYFHNVAKVRINHLGKIVSIGEF